MFGGRFDVGSVCVTSAFCGNLEAAEPASGMQTRPKIRPKIRKEVFVLTTPQNEHQTIAREIPRSAPRPQLDGGVTKCMWAPPQAITSGSAFQD